MVNSAAGGRKCVFCRSTPLTAEHVWPRWLRHLEGPAEIMKRPHDRNQPHTITRTAFDGDVVFIQTELRGRSIPALDVTVKIVCGRCNNGWMSQLEQRTKPTLARLIARENFTLQPDESATIAGWAFKTAAMFQYNDPQTRVVSADDLRAFRREMVPPPGVQVYAINMEDRTHAMRLCHNGVIAAKADSVSAGEPLPSRATLGSTFLAADRIAFLVRQSSLDGVEVAAAPDDPRIVQLWPSSESVSWPPPETSAPAADELARWMPGLMG